MTGTAATTTTDTTATDAGTNTASTDTTTGGGAAATATDATGTEATPPADDPAAWDPERAKRTIENQRRAESDLKRANAEMKAKLDEIERGKLSEQEKLAADLEAANKRADEAAKAVNDMRQSQAFDTAAIAAGIPPNALKAARAVAGDVATTDESGIVSIDDTVFDRLKAEHGYLFGQAAPPTTQVSFGSAASQGPGGKQGVTLTPDQIAMANKAGVSLEDFAKHAARTKR